jgi:hypothetical protein
LRTRMIDDTTGSPVIATGTALMAILTGGVFTKGAVGREGITRDSAPSAFSGGYLLPCALVRARGDIPDRMIRDEETRTISATQVVEVYLYEDSGYTGIDAAVLRLLALFIGYQFADSFPVEWINILDRERDPSLGNVSMARVDLLVRAVKSYQE